MRTRTTGGPASRGIVRWRRKQLVETGFPLALAAAVAADARFDLHALIELIERGCPPDLAVRILGPLDDRGAE